MTLTGADGAQPNRRAKTAPPSTGSDALRRRDRLVRAARRHTVLVRVLRVVFPLSVLASFVFYGIILKSTFGVGPGTLHVGKIEVTSDDLKMKNPSYFGVTQDNGKYEVRAREAAVDLAMTGPIKLEGIDGDLVQASGVKTTLKATRGALDNKKGELDLLDGVDIATSSGMVAHLLRAHIKTKEHFVSSRDPLVAEMPAGRLTAKGMDMWTDQKRAEFVGGVTLRLVQTPPGTGAQPSIGLGGDARQPVDISAQDMSINDQKSTAVFHWEVVAKQGETQLAAPILQVYYEGSAAAGAAATGTQAATGTTGSQLSRLEAYNGIVLTAGADRRLIAERVDFDVKADTALFTGNVELRQAKNVFRGGRLSVDRRAGKSRLDTPSANTKVQGRVAATLVQTPDPSRPAAPAKAKTATVDPSAVGGLQGDPNAPTDIEADTLDVDDQAKQAIFRGRVIAKQGDYVIHTAELIAHYAGQTGLMSSGSGQPVAKGSAAPAGAQITHLDTKGGTKITTKDGKEADGQDAHFDLKANVVTMVGPEGVTLKQEQNVTHGQKFRMNLTTGEAHIEHGPTGAQASATAPSPGELSIPAKPGVAPPAQPTACRAANGQPCMIIFNTDKLKPPGDGNKKGAPVAAPAKPAPAAEPQVSPSAVYRSN